MKREAMLERPAATGVSVDYPQEGERISARGYSFRITGAARAVEAAIDGGEWRPCRFAAGCWWLDWSGYGPGRHQLLVRARPREHDGYVLRTRRFYSEDAPIYGSNSNRKGVR